MSYVHSKKLRSAAPAILLLALLSVLLYPLAGYAQETNNTETQIIGHRGFSAFAPENTLGSFRRCLTMDGDMIELDVHLSADDSLMVIHDRTVDRTTNGTGDVQSLTYAALKKLDAGTWFCENYNDEKIPTLAEVLSLVDTQRILLIELKWPRKGIYKGMTKQVVELVKKCHLEKNVVIQSFEPRYLQEVMQLAPDIKTHQLIFGTAPLFPLYFDRTAHVKIFKPLPGVASVNCNYKFARKAFICKMHKKHVTVFVYTVNKPKQIMRAVRRGADGIITNNTLLAVRTLNKN